MTQAKSPFQRSSFDCYTREIDLIRGLLAERRETLASAIRERGLYFRVSIVGACNLDCPFCHNEGGPKKGKLDLEFALRAIRRASELGFERVQFTGGEPLMHPLLPDFISGARDILDDVGVTTNGTYLERKLTSIVRAGLRRIHISLQAESLCDPSGVKRWIIPGWLAPVLDLGREGVLNVRLNLPVPLQDLSLAREFLKELSPFQCGVNLFSILPKSECAIESRGDKALKELAVEENSRRELNSIAGKIIVRGYRAPTGIRCASCAEQKMCREQSHSLRLGVDRTLRPCLATRQWDIRSMDENDLGADIEAASLLALDYAWEG